MQTIHRDFNERGSSLIQKCSTVLFPEISLQINLADFSDSKTFQSFSSALNSKNIKGRYRTLSRIQEGFRTKVDSGKSKGTFLNLASQVTFSRSFGLPSPPKRLYKQWGWSDCRHGMRREGISIGSARFLQKTSLEQEYTCSVGIKLNHDPTVEFKNYSAVESHNTLDCVFLASGVFLTQQAHVKLCRSQIDGGMRTIWRKGPWETKQILQVRPHWEKVSVIRTCPPKLGDSQTRFWVTLLIKPPLLSTGKMAVSFSRRNWSTNCTKPSNWLFYSEESSLYKDELGILV